MRWWIGVGLSILFLLCACEQTTPASPTVAIEHTTPTQASHPIYDLLLSSAGYYADNRLYYVENHLLTYQNLETGQAHVLCYDPLCDHGDASACIARIAYDYAKIIAAEENGRHILFVSESCFRPNEKTKTTEQVHNLYRIDVDNMTRKAICKDSDTPIYDFYLYGDTLYVEMATPIEENGKISYEGNNLHAIPSDGGRMQQVTEFAAGEDIKLIGADDGYFYWCYDFSAGDVYRSLPDFSVTETVATGLSSLGLQYHDGYIYYMQSRGTDAIFEPPVVEGEFEEGVSYYKTMRRPLYDYYRIPCGVGREAECVAQGICVPATNVVMNMCTFFIDDNTNKAYAVPLDLSLDGTIVWEMDLWTMQAFGHSGKPILTGIFSETGGRLLEIDLETLETRDVLSDIGADILDIYGMTDGTIAVQQKITDTDRLRAMQAAGLTTDSTLSVTEYAIYPIK